MTSTPRHSVSVAAVVTDDTDKILVIKRRDTGAWQLPGGVLELHETIEDGVRREVEEETGVRVNPDRLTGIYKNMPRGIIALVFRCKITGDHVDTKTSPTTGRERRVRRLRASRPACLRSPSRRWRCRGLGSHGQSRRRDRHRDSRGGQGAARLRLLLGRDRRPARHYPPSCAATMGG